MTHPSLSLRLFAPMHFWKIELGSQIHTIYGVLPHLTILQPTGHVMHDQFNIQQLYALPTLYLCVLYLSENKQRLVPLTA